MSEKQEQLPVSTAILVGAIIIGLSLIIAFSGNKNGGGKVIDSSGTGVATIESAGKAVGVNAKKLEECLASDRMVAEVDADKQNADLSGGSGTPFSVLITKDGTTLPVSGALETQALNMLIDGLLSGERSEDVIDVAAADTEADLDPTRRTPGASQRIVQSTATNGGVLPQLVNNTSLQVAPVLEDEPFRGKADAEITLVEYSDIDCPFCQRFHGTLEQLIKDRNDVRWVYRHSPIVGLHPNAPAKAEAAECVLEITGSANKYWEYLDLLIVGK